MGYLREISIESHQRNEVIRLDEQVTAFVADSGMKEGVCHIFMPHTTAGVIVNEGADPDVARDILGRLAPLVPHQGGYAHA